MTKFSAHGVRECKSAVSTVKVKKEKVVKSEVLSGWRADDTQDEYDITAWAKRRESQEAKPVSERKASQITKWDQYVCTVVKKCRSIENVQVYMDNSLSVFLKPVPSHLEKEPTKVKLKHSLTQLQLNNSGKHPVILEQTAKEILEETELGDKKKSVQNTKGNPVENDSKKSENSSAEKTNGKSIDANNEKSNCDKDKEKKYVSNESSQEQKDRQSEPSNILAEVNKNNIDGDLIGINDTNSEVLSESDEKSEDKEVAQPVPVARFGYTNANISLSGVQLYDPLDGEEEGGPLTSRAKTSINYKPNVVEIETIAQLEKYQNNGQAQSMKQVTKEKRVLHTTNLTNIPLVPGYVQMGPKSSRSGGRERILTSKSESNIHVVDDNKSVLAVKKKKGEQEFSGMTVASIKTARKLGSARSGRSQSEQLLNIPDEIHNGDDNSEKPAYMSQKQVLLVLKNVTLKDGFDDYNPSKSSYNSPRTFNNLTPTNGTNGFRQIENLINRAANKSVNNRHDSSHPMEHHGRQQHNGAYFPLADLLPVVDNSIRNSMPARYIRQLDTLGLIKGDGDGGKSLISSEEKVFNMNDGAEFLRQRNNTLGRPTFRPPNNKTPLQRAKENTKKRLDSSNLSQTVQQMGDINDKSRWSSSAGQLYKSRPGSSDENLIIKQDKSSDDRLVTPVPYCTGKYKPPPWLSKLSRSKQRTDLLTDSEATSKQLQQVSNALSSRLHDLARQRNSQHQELYDRSPIS